MEYGMVLRQLDAPRTPYEPRETKIISEEVLARLLVKTEEHR